MEQEIYYQKPTKYDYINAHDTWFKSISESWISFATTVVFQSSGYKPRPEYWLQEYKHNFIWKINKILSRNANHLVFYDDFCRYEFGESSLYKSVKDQRKPHHVHGIIFIPKELVHKVWNQEINSITQRLSKDFKSIRNISSVLIEPIREDEMKNWIGYMTKGKVFFSNDHH